MFGTDATPNEDMYRNFLRRLETGNEYFDYCGPRGEGRWKIYGMVLSDPVLEKVYNLNMKRVFKQFRGVPPSGCRGQ
jgi:hypothetical protein